jgi:hypothetical protein
MNGNDFAFSSLADFAIFLTRTGEVLVWGDNRYNGLGLGEQRPRNYVLRPTEHTSPLLRGERRLRTVACGTRHVLALSETPELNSPSPQDDPSRAFPLPPTDLSILLVWGEGAARKPFTPRPVKRGPESAKKIIQLSCGVSHSAFLLEGGSVYTWGANTDYQLGNRNYQTDDPSRVLYFLLPRLAFGSPPTPLASSLLLLSLPHCFPCFTSSLRLLALPHLFTSSPSNPSTLVPSGSSR